MRPSPGAETSVVLPTAAHGVGWERLASAVGEVVPVASIVGIWLFRPVRKDDREWGTAVVACRTANDRLRVYTASYLISVRGRDRRQGRMTVEEVGESPPEVLDDVLQGVQERAGEPEPPVAVAPSDWYPEPSETEGDRKEGTSGGHPGGDRRETHIGE